jgi:hypothetical protein
VRLVLGNERLLVGSSSGRVPAGEVERETEDPQDEARDSQTSGESSWIEPTESTTGFPCSARVLASVYTQTSAPMMTSTARFGTNWTSDI